MDFRDYLEKVQADELRNNTLLHLTANEPYLSEIVRSAQNLCISDRYYFGVGDPEGVVDFQPSTYLGLPGVGQVVQTAEAALKSMLNASEVNLGCLSGVHAMTCAILATTQPGEVIITVGLEHGGHFSTKTIIERTGRVHVYAPYDIENQLFDIEELTKIQKISGAKVFYMDVSFYISPHNLRDIRNALGEDVIIIYDASHTIGLIMSGYFQDPFNEGADVICANTHKTLPGPQKGLVAFKDKEFGAKCNDVINGGLFSSPHTGSMIGLSYAILEMQQFGEEYARDIILNSNELGRALEALGLPVRKSRTGRYSENHQVHLITEGIGDYRLLYKKLLNNNISVNFSNTLGGDMFIRLGTQEITRRGMGPGTMRKIAHYIQRALNGEKVKKEVDSLVNSHRDAHYSFDSMLI